MKQLFFTFIFIITLSFVYAQNGIENDYLFQNSNSGMQITEIPMQKGETKGSVYISDSWNTGNVRLIGNKEVRDCQLNYNLRSHMMELKSEDEVRVLAYSQIEFFTWINQTTQAEVFVNTSLLSKNTPDLELTGFFQVLYDGDTKLLDYYTVELIEANYNATMNAGSKSDKYVKKSHLYIYKDTKLYPVKSKRSILNVLSNKKSEVQDYAKQNKLSFKDKKDLVSIINYYNTISK